MAPQAGPISSFVEVPELAQNNEEDTSVDGHVQDNSSKSSCFERFLLKINILEKDATPPNWKYIGLVFAALFSAGNTLTFLFPFLPEMVLFLGYDENEKGMYSGIIASSIFAGRIFGCMFWGWLTDRKGRKIVLLITLALNAVFSFGFGFATNIYMAVFMRFMSGMVNGTVGTVKTILYDISDNTNQAISMTMLSIAWGSSLIAGPMVGGLLASPASKWPNVFADDGLFGQFPFLLASSFPLVTCTVGFLVILFFFDETLVVACKRGKTDMAVKITKTDGVDSLEATHSGQSRVVGHAPLLRSGSTPHQFGSNISLNPVAEMSICLGKEAMERQDNLEKARLTEINFLTKSAPDLTPDRVEISQGHDLGRDSGDTIHSHLVKRRANASHSDRGANTENGNVEHYSPLLPTKESQTPAAKHRHLLYQRSVSNDPQGHISHGLVDFEKDKLTAVTKEPLHLTDCDYGEEAINGSRSSLSLAKEEEEGICKCTDWLCKLPCCGMLRNSGLHRILRLSNAWASIMLYTTLSFVTIGIDDIFPVFASTHTDYGGLAFSSDKIGLAMGGMVMPLLFLQVKLYPFLVRRFGIRKTFIICSIICVVCAQMIPLVRLVKYSPVMLWTSLMVVQIPLKIAVNCCFASTSLLINNAVTPDLAGQVNGLAMTTTAIGRTLSPIMAGALFSWCVTYGPDVGTLFDISFPFFIMGFLYGLTCIECLFIKPSLDKQQK